MTIRFEKAGSQHQKIIFEWLEEPHIKEFWDNSQDHKEDILNFIHNRKQHYFYGTTHYWIAFIHDEPYGFLLTDQMLESQNDLSDAHRKYLSKNGHTIALDFCIGNKGFLEKGLGALTLETFITFFNNRIDPQADTFFIDPDENNPRAAHVYEKAGFKKVGNYKVKEGVFKEQQSHLMVKKMKCILGEIN